LPSVSDQASFLGKYVYTIDNMKISLPELIPENVHLRFEMDLDAKPLELEAETKHTYVYLQASNIHVHLHDANWTYNRLTAPKLHDAGIFDVDTIGNGMTIWMKMEVKGEIKADGSGISTSTHGASKDYLTVLKSDVKINQNFHITFRESHHDKLYEMLTHLFANKIKKSVTELMQEKLKVFGTYFSDQLIALIEQARTKSDILARVAHEKKAAALEKKEDLRANVERLKLQTKEAVGSAVDQYEGRQDVQESREEAKSVAKNLVVKAHDVIQDKLDEQKEKIEEQKRDNELKRLTSQTGSNAPLPSTLYYPSDTQSH